MDMENLAAQEKRILNKIIQEERKFYLQYWKHYIALEKKVLDTERFITFDKSNFKSFSIEFDILLQAICSEIDVISKRLCLEYNKDSNANNMTDYIESLFSYEPSIAFEKIVLDIYDLEFTPWKSISTTRITEDGDLVQNSPQWWSNYNDIKHRRIETSKNNNEFDILKHNYKAANLGNVLNALAALYILEKHCRDNMLFRFSHELDRIGSKLTYEFTYPDKSIFDKRTSFVEQV